MTMPPDRDLQEVYQRRVSKTRDTELKWLLEELAGRLEVATNANRVVFLAISDIHQAWEELGVLTKKEEDK